MTMKSQQLRMLGYRKSSAMKEVYRNRSLPQETRGTSNNLNLHLKQLEKEVPKQQQQQKKTNVSRSKEIMKIRAEIKKKRKRL